MARNDPRDPSPSPDEPDLAKTVIDGTVVKDTGTGEALVCSYHTGSGTVTVEPDADDGPGTSLQPSDLLARLKCGDYYLPDGPSGFMEALRAVRDEGPD